MLKLNSNCTSLDGGWQLLSTEQTNPRKRENLGKIFCLHRNYEADIRTDSDHLADEFGLDYDFPHTYAPVFNPYKESRYHITKHPHTDM